MGYTDEDFRARLYASYVSGFKRESLDTTASSQAAYSRWADARYYPLLAHLPRDAAILELGCGPGRLLRYLHDKGFSNVVGVDVSPEQTAIAIRYGLEVVTRNIAQHLECHENDYDAVVLLDVVEHFTKPELLHLFELIHKSLKVTGLVMYQTVNGEGLYPNQVMFGDLTHMTILTPGSSEQMLYATGFDQIQFADTGPVPSGLRGVLRYVAWSIITRAASLVRRIETGKHHRIWTENFICTAKKFYEDVAS